MAYSSCLHFLGGVSFLCILFCSASVYRTGSQWIHRFFRKHGAGEESLTFIPVSEVLYERQYPARARSCIYNHFLGKPLCKHSINEPDANHAKTFRNLLARYVPQGPRLKHMLDCYTQRCLCKRHRKRMQSTSHLFWERQLDRWCGEIYDNINEDAQPEIRALENTHGWAVMNELIGQLRLSLPYLHDTTTPAPPGDFPAFQPFATKHLDYHGPEEILDRVMSGIINRHAIRFDRSNIENSHTVRPSHDDFSDSSIRAISTFAIILNPLNSSEQGYGHIYIYATDTDDESTNDRYLKIGHTTKSVAGRLNEINKKCNNVSKVVFSTKIKCPHAKRVEKLIHNELSLLRTRRDDHRCKMRSGKCRSKHTEWFEVGINEAVQVAEHWIKWMTNHNPYGADNFIRPELLNLAVVDEDLNTVEHSGSYHAVVENTYTNFLLDSKARYWYRPDYMHHIRERQPCCEPDTTNAMIFKSRPRSCSSSEITESLDLDATNVTPSTSTPTQPESTFCSERRSSVSSLAPEHGMELDNTSDETHSNATTVSSPNSTASLLVSPATSRSTSRSASRSISPSSSPSPLMTSKRRGRHQTKNQLLTGQVRDMLIKANSKERSVSMPIILKSTSPSLPEKRTVSLPTILLSRNTETGTRDDPIEISDDDEN